MQGINWGISKELKKYFISYKIEEMTTNHFIFQQYLSMIYAMIAI